MKVRSIIRITVDLAMTVILLLLMAYEFTGSGRHMSLGMAEFVLFIIHCFLNRKWYAALFKGRYNLSRVMRTLINFGVLASMVGLMISAAILSDGFGLIDIRAGVFFARRLHMPSSHWGFIFMSLHLGLHWRAILGAMKKRFGAPKKTAATALKIAAAAIAVFGVYAFISDDILSYMLLTREFAGFDDPKGFAGIIADYASIMGTCVYISHYAAPVFDRIFKRPKKADAGLSPRKVGGMVK